MSLSATSKIRGFIRLYFLSRPLWQTKKFGDKVLDLGCGHGFYFGINPNAWGIDIDDDCVNSLQSRGHKVVKGDIRKKLPFDDGFFQCVVCHDVLEHLELNETKNVFNEARRILGTGGSFFILIPNKRGFEFGLKSGAGHKHLITLREILSIAEGKFVLQKHFFNPLPKIIGDYFTHNKEVLDLKKI